MPANVTPIDPGDVESLGRIAYDNNTILPGTIGTPATWDEMARWPDEKEPWRNSALAVARSVVPPHHAVYDTRTHTVIPNAMYASTLATLTQTDWPEMALVPVDVLSRVLSSHDRRCGDDADIEALEALLPDGGDDANHG